MFLIEATTARFFTFGPNLQFTQSVGSPGFAWCLPNARGEERSDGRVRTMLLLVASVLAIRLGPLASLETHHHGPGRMELLLEYLDELFASPKAMPRLILIKNEKARKP